MMVTAVAMAVEIARNPNHDDTAHTRVPTAMAKPRWWVTAERSQLDRTATQDHL